MAVVLHSQVAAVEAELAVAASAAATEEAPAASVAEEPFAADIASAAVVAEFAVVAAVVEVAAASFVAVLAVAVAAYQTADAATFVAFVAPVSGTEGVPVPHLPLWLDLEYLPDLACHHSSLGRLPSNHYQQRDLEYQPWTEQEHLRSVQKHRQDLE